MKAVISISEFVELSTLNTYNFFIYEPIVVKPYTYVTEVYQNPIVKRNAQRNRQTKILTIIVSGSITLINMHIINSFFRIYLPSTDTNPLQFYYKYKYLYRLIKPPTTS